MSRCAFLFPGQGAQYPGMGRNLVEHFPESRELLERAETHLNLPLGELMFFASKERLDDDFTAQVTVYTVSCMVATILEARGIFAGAVAPYSSGLYAAAYAAGAYDFETGLTLMREADLCIRNEMTDGAMGVVLGLSALEVEELCARVPGTVQVSIINTRHQTIVSGDRSSVLALLQLAQDAEALKTDILPARAPYHCRLLKKADIRLARVVEGIELANPHTPLFSYIDCSALTSAEDIASLLSNQLGNPVQWVGVIEELVRREMSPMLEIGPGQMLGRSARWIYRRANVLYTETASALEESVGQLTACR